MSAQDSLGACPECGAPCHDSPSGVVCTNGHGGVEPVAPGGLPVRCPGCGASFVEALPKDGALYECGTIASPGRVARSRACELLEESVEVIHQLQGELGALTTPPAVTHQSAENALPVRAYFTSRRMVPESLQKLRGKAQVFLGMASQAFSVVTHQDHHPEPERLRLVYGPDMKRAVQQLADLREEVLLFIDLLQAPRR